MPYISSLCAAVMIGCFVRSQITQSSDERKLQIYAGSTAALIGFIFAFFSSVTVVSAGKVGVLDTWGEVDPKPIISGGIKFVNPFSSVHYLSVQTDVWNSHPAQNGLNAHEDSISVRASNGLTMPVDISVPYRLQPDAAPWVYKNVGMNWVHKILVPSLKSAFNRAGSHYTPEELYSTKREEFTEKTGAFLVEELNKLLQDNYKNQNPPESVVIFNQVLIGYIGIPETVKLAIEAKLKADQEQQAMDFLIMKARKEAERKKIEAEGIHKFQSIVSEGIDEKLLRWKAIEATLELATSSNAKIIVIGSGRDGLPVLLGSDGEPHIQTKPSK